MSKNRMDLAAPSVDHVIDGQLDPNSLPESGTEAHILEVLPEWGGEMLYLYLRDDQGAVLYQDEWPLGPHGRPVSLPIPKAVLVENLGKDVAVDYSITNVGQSYALEFKLGQGFAGAVEFDLASHNYIVAYTHSQARPPEQLPDFTRMQRVLPGATGYASDNESVARVDNQGIVTAVSNGQATITASGAPGGSASYQLTVKGIAELHVVSSKANWEGAERLCNELGLALPTPGDFARLLDFYPPPVDSYLELPNYPVWGTFLGANTANTFDLNRGVAEAQDIAAQLQAAGILRS